MDKHRAKLMAGFLIPSIIGIVLFMIPIKYKGSWTIIVKIIADEISYAAENVLPTLCVVILTTSALGALIGKAAPQIMQRSELLKSTVISILIVCPIAHLLF